MTRAEQARGRADLLRRAAGRPSEPARRGSSFSGSEGAARCRRGRARDPEPRQRRRRARRGRAAGRRRLDEEDAQVGISREQRRRRGTGFDARPRPTARASRRRRSLTVDAPVRSSGSCRSATSGPVERRGRAPRRPRGPARLAQRLSSRAVRSPSPAPVHVNRSAASASRSSRAIGRAAVRADDDGPSRAQRFEHYDPERLARATAGRRRSRSRIAQATCARESEPPGSSTRPSRPSSCSARPARRAPARAVDDEAEAGPVRREHARTPSSSQVEALLPDDASEAEHEAVERDESGASARSPARSTPFGTTVPRPSGSRNAGTRRRGRRPSRR